MTNNENNRITTSQWGGSLLIMEGYLKYCKYLNII